MLDMFEIKQSVLIKMFSTAVLFSLCTYVVAAERINCREPQSTPEINYCSQMAFEKADKTLNEQYRKTMSGLSGAKKAQLRKEQRAWLHQLVPTCMEATKSEKEGTIWPSEFSACLKDKTEERTRKIQAWGS